jgi:hypothetical protein
MSIKVVICLSVTEFLLPVSSGSLRISYANHG